MHMPVQRISPTWTGKWSEHDDDFRDPAQALFPARLSEYLFHVRLVFLGQVIGSYDGPHVPGEPMSLFEAHNYPWIFLGENTREADNEEIYWTDLHLSIHVTERATFTVIKLYEDVPGNGLEFNTCYLSDLLSLQIHIDDTSIWVDEPATIVEPPGRLLFSWRRETPATAVYAWQPIAPSMIARILETRCATARRRRWERLPVRSLLALCPSFELDELAAEFTRHTAAAGLIGDAHVEVTLRTLTDVMDAFRAVTYGTFGSTDHRGDPTCHRYIIPLARAGGRQELEDKRQELTERAGQWLVERCAFTAGSVLVHFVLLTHLDSISDQPSLTYQPVTRCDALFGALATVRRLQGDQFDDGHPVAPPLRFPALNLEHTYYLNRWAPHKPWAHLYPFPPQPRRAWAHAPFDLHYAPSLDALPPTTNDL